MSGVGYVMPCAYWTLMLASVPGWLGSYSLPLTSSTVKVAVIASSRHSSMNTVRSAWFGYCYSIPQSRAYSGQSREGVSPVQPAQVRRRDRRTAARKQSHELSRFHSLQRRCCSNGTPRDVCGGVTVRVEAKYVVGATVCM